MEGLFLLFGALCALIVLGRIESFWHRRHLSQIPIRIHVNGTRGKSSVTRLIAAGLRAGGVRTCAKTTGTLPRFIYPNGSEEPVFRATRANVIEQVGIVRKAVEQRAEALVLECMAVHPTLQSLCELHLVCSTHGVITNVRPDHLDVMGPTQEHVARALAGTVPVGGTVFTAESNQLAAIQHAAADRHSTLVTVTETDRLAVLEDLSAFSHLEHPDNVALALRVCMELGVNRQTALEGMWDAEPDPGAMRILEVCRPFRRLLFVNGFAANDPLSTEQGWRLAGQQVPDADARVVVVNCRSDRADRSVQMAEMCARWDDVDRYLVIGTGTRAFSKRAAAVGLDRPRVIVAEGWDADRIYDEIATLPGSTVLAMGIGNMGGVGLQLVDCFHDRASGHRPVYAEFRQKVREAA